MNIHAGQQNRSVSINEENKQVLNEFVLPADTQEVKASVQGGGSVLVSLDYEHVEQAPEKPSFTINLSVAAIQRLIVYASSKDLLNCRF